LEVPDERRNIIMRARILKTVLGSGVLLCVAVYAATVSATGEEKHSDPFRSCVSAECHAPIVEHKYLHGPLVVGQCTVCHLPLPGPEHKFGIEQNEAGLCRTCHNRVDREEVLHEPVAEGRCLECHDPHGSAARSHIRKSSVARLCAECHEEVVTKKHTHDPVTKGECLGCHRAHGSKEGKLLDTSGNTLCFHCHEEMDPAADGGTKGKIHLLEEDCSGCHRPHDSDYAGLLAGPPLELCFGCHEDLKEMMESSDFRHKAVTEGLACIECHKAHNSRLASLLREQASDLCFSCHDDLKARIDVAEFKHRPVQDNACNSCHMPHSSRYTKRLFAEFPSGPYSSYDPAEYALCFSCHDDTIAGERYTKTDTGFRNGTLNLHFLHVNKEYKGRTCLACHDGHASSHPKLIRDEAPFGDWKRLIRFAGTETGGSCDSGCHEEYAYDRISPVKLKAE